MNVSVLLLLDRLYLRLILVAIGLLAEGIREMEPPSFSRVLSSIDEPSCVVPTETSASPNGCERIKLHTSLSMRMKPTSTCIGFPDTRCLVVDLISHIFGLPIGKMVRHSEYWNSAIFGG